MRNETHNGETYNCFGGDARKIDMGSLEEHGTSITALRKDVRKNEVCINGGLVYTIKHKRLKSGHAKRAHA